eukprot:2206391-Rhodomonas_salina.1
MAPSRSLSKVPCREDANMNLALDSKTAYSSPARLITSVAIWSTTQANAALLTADCTDVVVLLCMEKACCPATVRSRRFVVLTSSYWKPWPNSAVCSAKARNSSMSVRSCGDITSWLLASTAVAHVTPSEAFTRCTTAINLG